MARRLTTAARPVVVAALLATLTLAPVVVSGAAAVPPQAARQAVSARPAVTWQVDHASRTITVTVNIAVFVERQPTEPRALESLAAAAARIEADIRSTWAGLMFKCYRFVVEPHVRSASGPDDVEATEFGVQLDTGIYPAGGGRTGSQAFRSFVRGIAGDAHLSDDPQDGLEVEAGPQSAADRSVWAFIADDGTYAHEFGHLLLLPDGYTEGAGSPLRPGSPEDLMFRTGRPLAPESVTKIVRLSGEVDESTIKCPFSIDLPETAIGLPTGVPGTAGGSVAYHAWACDYDPPSSDTRRRTPIGFTVDFVGAAGANAGPFGSVDGSAVTRFDVLMAPPETGAQALFVIDLGTGGTVQTPLRWGSSGLRAAGNAFLTAGGEQLNLSTGAVVSDGAIECE
ncbi:MAG: hypothetical protein Q7V88_09595 [Actinomycetota bacterium]|nr:hypothetical protein [Actinomycetota bacterium]